MSKTACCRVCQQERASLVCVRCLRLNLKVFHRRCAEARAHNDAQAGRVDASLARRALRRDELLFRLANVRREADYTRSLTSDGGRSARQGCAAACGVRAREAGGAGGERRGDGAAQGVQPRAAQGLARRLRPHRRPPADARPRGARALQARAHTGARHDALRPDRLARRRLSDRRHHYPLRLAAQRLPHGIQLPSSTQPTTSLTHGTQHETYSLRHDRDISAFAMACAMLVVDVHHLASMQQMSLDAEEHDLGRMLLSIGKAAALGQLSDEAARAPVREQDRPKTLSVRRLAARIVEEHHVNEQWETVNLASLSNSGELERSSSELVAGSHPAVDTVQLPATSYRPALPTEVASVATQRAS